MIIFFLFRCSKSCGYGGFKTKRRSPEITKKGTGEPCRGATSHRKPCFERCCRGQFHCSSRRKCISNNLKCNYRNNCGDRQDERDSICNEYCYNKYTSWHSAGGGSVWYLDRQQGSCYGRDVIQSLQLVRSGNSQRYKMRCCRWHKNLYTRRHTKHNGWNRLSNIGGLTGQNIRCNNDRELLHSFVIDGKWKKKSWISIRKSFYIKYWYRCDRVTNTTYRMTCRNGATRRVSRGNRKTQRLDGLNIDCRARFGARWFLNQFQLRESHGRIWYNFRCCRIVV